MRALRQRVVPQLAAPRDAGAAAVEMALVAPLLLALVLGVIGFGRAYHTKLELSNAAQEGARRMVFYGGSTPTTTSTATAATIAAASVTPSLGAGEVSITGSCTTAFSQVTVTASRQVTFDFVLGAWNRTITGTAVMRCAG